MEKITLKIFLILVLSLSYNDTFADEENRPIAYSYMTSEFVFSGKVINKKTYTLDLEKEYLDSLSKIYRKIIRGISVIEYQVLIEKQYKNKIVEDTVIIRERAGLCDSHPLKIGESYIFFENKIIYKDYIYDNKKGTIVYGGRNGLYDKEVELELLKIKEELDNDPRKYDYLINKKIKKK